MRPTVSICVRAWRRDSLPAAIESALAQTYSDLEVVVSDDRGDLEDVALATGDPRVRYYRNEEPLGTAGNARAALGRARGAYLGILGDDDRLLPDYVETVMSRFEDDPELGIVFAGVYYDYDGRLVRRPTPLAAGRYDAFLPDLIRHRPVEISVTMMRRELWEQGERCDPLREPMVADLHMWIRAALAGWPFHYVDEPLAVVSVHAGQTSAQHDWRGRIVELWEHFRFDDPECERLRKQRLAEALVSVALSHVAAGRTGPARAALARAAEADPTVERARRLSLQALAAAPFLGPLAYRAWTAYRVLRPYRPWFLKAA